jgi:hypothetical protein
MLRVYSDGRYYYIDTIGKLHGNAVDQRPIIGVTNVLYVTFYSSRYISDVGFNLTYLGKY